MNFPQQNTQKKNDFRARSNSGKNFFIRFCCSPIFVGVSAADIWFKIENPNAKRTENFFTLHFHYFPLKVYRHNSRSLHLKFLFVLPLAEIFLFTFLENTKCAKFNYFFIRLIYAIASQVVTLWIFLVAGKTPGMMLYLNWGKYATRLSTTR